MAHEAVTPGAVFPLHNIAAGLDGFRVPHGAFEPGGSWRHTYRVCTLTRACDRVGELMLERMPRDGGAQLAVRLRRFMPGRTEYRLEGVIDCRGDVLAAPRAWAFESETRDGQGKLVPNTRIVKRGRIEKDGMHGEDEVSRRTIPVTGACTNRWALFDAVQRLPRNAFPPLTFSLLDDFDQVKPGHRLSWHASLPVLLGEKCRQQVTWQDLERGRVKKTRWVKEGGEEALLTAYDHVGEGIVPWIYWVDAAGRLLFAIGGLEAYILETAEG